MTSGIYAIVNKENGHRYVGSSRQIEKRQTQHIAKLEKGGHPNAHLQAAWDKHGKDNFAFITLIECDNDALLRHEQEYLDARPEYNLSFIAGKIEMTEGTRQRISIGNTGKPHGKKGPFSEEHRRHMSEALVVRMSSEKERERVRESNRTRIWSEESLAKASASHAGAVLSEEHKDKLRIAFTGRTFSDEAKAKMSEAQKGNTKAAGHKNALGYHHTEETKARLREKMQGNTHARKEGK